jgi:two-component system response regulator AtoC
MNTAISMDTISLSILVIDDDDEVRRSLCAVLSTTGYSVTSATSTEDGLRLINANSYDLIISDLKLPGLSGLDLLKGVGRRIPVILMTAYGNSRIALEAAQLGAYDYISKPILADELIFKLHKFTEYEKLRRENSSLKEEISGHYSFNKIIARSEAFKGVFETVKRLAPFNTTVMITGESGTGKELLARAIHENSPRRGKPFVAINCGAIPENLMESELFGHKKGAFTDASRDKKGLFEEATGGTLFLDEIGELPLHLQVKLLRALQEQSIRRVGDEQLIPIDVRIISATLRNLEHDAKAGRFREDLLYRLNVISLHLLPLRERSEDIPLLVEHFLSKHAKRLGIAPKRVSPDVMKLLLSQTWRGNARELENCIERALVLSHGEEIEQGVLPEYMLKNTRPEQSLPSDTDDTGKDSNLSIKQRTRELEIRLIKRVLAQTNGNRTHAARILEISHRALLYKLKEYEL